MILQNHLLYFSAIVSLIRVSNGQNCDWVRRTFDVATRHNHCLQANVEEYEAERDTFHCVQKCTFAPNCTGVMAHGLKKTNWCCYLNDNPIGVRKGNNVLFHKPEVEVTCLKGYNPDTGCEDCLVGYDPNENCATCLKNRRWTGRYTPDNSEYPPDEVWFDITFFGPTCAGITGEVGGNVMIVGGEINRKNKTWSIIAENGTKMNAKLEEWNMVDGKGRDQPNFRTFTFYADF